MTQHLNHFIEGASFEASDGRRMTLVDPVTEQIYGSSARGTVEDVDRAVAAALTQLEGGAWSQLDGAQRGRLLSKLADLVERDTDVLADLDANAIGRSPIEPRRLDVPNAIANLRAAAGWANQLEGRTIPTGGYFGTKALSYTIREPVGVVGAIVPWNSPLMITVWKLAALLAAGCTVVIKPSEETPQSALHLAALAQEAGFPDGVINVVTGYGTEVGRALCEHPHVAKISFTGSPEAGREIQRTAGVLFKHVALELGGKAHRSSSTTPRSRTRCSAARSACSPTRDRSARLARASWSNATSLIASPQRLPMPREPSRSVTLGNPTYRWDRWPRRRNWIASTVTSNWA